jgi:carboxyl-terminal processing protease
MLTIKRRGEGKTAEVPLTRATITIQTVKGYARKDGHWDYLMDPDLRITYIRLTSFMERTTQELEQALQRIAEQKARGLIVDLRFNTGGLLRTAVEVADLFLPSGQVIVSTKGRNSPGWSQPANGSEADPGLDLIVLVNKYSASASEILAGAIQDNHRGLVVGQRSYGKGSVQNLIPVGDGSAYLKLTTALYYLPSGRCIDRQDHQALWGVDPDIPVSLIPEETQKVLELRRKSDVVSGKLGPLPGPGDGPEPGDLDAPSEEGPPATTKPADDVPDVDPALETALLVMRFKLMSGLAWRPEPLGPTSARAASQTD